MTQTTAQKVGKKAPKPHTTRHTGETSSRMASTLWKTKSIEPEFFTNPGVENYIRALLVEVDEMAEGIGIQPICLQLEPEPGEDASTSLMGT